MGYAQGDRYNLNLFPFLVRLLPRSSLYPAVEGMCRRVGAGLVKILTTSRTSAILDMWSVVRRSKRGTLRRNLRLSSMRCSPVFFITCWKTRRSNAQTLALVTANKNLKKNNKWLVCWNDQTIFMSALRNWNRKNNLLFSRKKKKGNGTRPKEFFYSVADWQRSMLLSSCLLD